MFTNNKPKDTKTVIAHIAHQCINIYIVFLVLQLFRPTPIPYA